MSELNQFACCIGKYKNFAVNDDSELSAGKIKKKERMLAEAVEEILKRGMTGYIRWTWKNSE